MTGFCIHGCNGGWYGANCSTQCNPRCVNMSCTDSGACVAGCAPGYAGSDCSCFENCIDHICLFEDGTCAKGCANGYYGAFCNTTCEICIDGICDRESGTCTKGCNITDQRCKSTCSSDCPIDTCVKEITCGGPPAVDSRNIIIILLTVLCLGGVLFASCVCLRKYSSTCRTNQADHYLEAYQPAPNMYWEVRDAEVDLENRPPDTEATGQRVREVQAHETDHDSASDGASEDSLSYSHLMRNIPLDDETTVYHKYIPPAEDTTTRN
ncbi:scavenger receptor class F member 1-like [Haliotis rufescens]|uniref:scavenger receptor class F member 1-like n=1 Tax=Haliotis rufescens TaxID=6454 RepID=UPI00201E9BD2|nr:scavenger receptor class F member 1-like [Haliotis rufescens]